jgi:hypothetical protein
MPQITRISDNLRDSDLGTIRNCFYNTADVTMFHIWINKSFFLTDFFAMEEV